MDSRTLDYNQSHSIPSRKSGWWTVQFKIVSDEQEFSRILRTLKDYGEPGENRFDAASESLKLEEISFLLPNVSG